jgi:hypothetical protein
MRSPASRVLLFASITFLLAITALAQRRYVISNVTIPFAFSAGSEEFPAGDYVLDSSSPGYISVRSKDGKISGRISVLPVGDAVKRTEARLIFVKRDGRYVLRELWGVLGRWVPTSEYGKDENKSEETREVRLTFPG